MRKRVLAFTLLEVIVVMALIAILLALSIQGLILFRASTEVKESGRQLSSILDLIRNGAKNDVRPSNSTADFKGYSYSFIDDRLEHCNDVYVGDQLQQEWVCVYDEEVEDTFFNLVFPVNLGPGDDYSNPDALPICDSVFFESLTADILITISDNTPPSTNTSCVVPFTDFGENLTGYLYIDALSDTYKVLSNLNGD